MGIVYIAVLLASGVVFSQLHYPSKYQLNRSEGWVSYAKIILPGLVALGASLPLLLWAYLQNFGRYLSQSAGISRDHIKEWGFSIGQIKLMIWFACSFLLSFCAGLISYVWYYHLGEFSQRKLSRKTRRLAQKDPLELMVFENIEQRSYVQNDRMTFLLFSLKSRRFYVGICDNIALEHGQISDIRITPMLSGYRSAENFKLQITVNYREHFKTDPDFTENMGKTLSKYKVVLSRDEIETVSLFDPLQYKDLSEPKPKLADSSKQ